MKNLFCKYKFKENINIYDLKKKIEDVKILEALMSPSLLIVKLQESHKKYFEVVIWRPLALVSVIIIVFGLTS